MTVTLEPQKLLERLWQGWEVKTEADIDDVLAAVENLLLCTGYSGTEWHGIQAALREALVNGCKHGNQWDQRKKVTVLVLNCSREKFEVRIRDEGTGFNPDEVPDATLPENLERSSGRGLLIMRHYMDVAFESPGNAVTLTNKKTPTNPA